MDVWRRLRGEPAKLRAAITRRNRRQLAGVVRRLQVALGLLASEPVPTSVDTSDTPARYERLAKLAPVVGVHPKTLGRWLDKDAPDALLKRSRLILVDKLRFAEWDARRKRASGGGRG